MERQPLVVQTLYAELMEQMLALEASRSIGDVQGCFTTKKIKGEEYVYFQYSDPGGQKRQTYIGKKCPSLGRVMDRFYSDRESVKEDQNEVKRLCALLRAGGAMTTDIASARVLKAFAQSGLFRMGAVLVGTHAFTVLGNLLGVKWLHSALHTQDVDIAGEPRLDIAFPQVKRADTPQILDQLEMGFLPVPGFNPGQPSTSFKVRGKSLRVDFLTPARGSKDTGPVPIPRFGVAAQPLPFLDFLMEHAEHGAVVNGGGVLVQAPSPARFALHKLILFGERGMTAQTKAEKDLLQASQLIQVLTEGRPGDLILAWEAVETRGKGWTKRLGRGLDALKHRFPDVHALMQDIVQVKQ